MKKLKKQLEDPRILLDDIIYLIKKDIDHIRGMVELGKLDKDSSQDLARYSSAIMSIVKDSSNQEEIERKSVSKLTTEELKAKALAILGNNAKNTN